VPEDNNHHDHKDRAEPAARSNDASRGTLPRWRVAWAPMFNRL
jgi:hypothetical protein